MNVRPLTYHGPGASVETADYALTVWAPTDSGFPAGHRSSKVRDEWIAAYDDTARGDTVVAKTITGYATGATLDEAFAALGESIVGIDQTYVADALDALVPMADAIRGWFYPPTRIRHAERSELDGLDR